MAKPQWRAAWALIGVGVLSTGQAGPLAPADLPATLRDWLPWAQHGQSPANCPKSHDGEGEAACVWPSRLELQVGAREGRLRFEVQVFGAPARVTLPGEAGAWPQDVKAGAAALAVTEAEGAPGVWLPVGRHVIEGRIVWPTPPQDLALPKGVATVVVNTEGQTQARQPDAQGRLWLRAAATDAQAADSVELHTTRLIDDDVPLRVSTAFTLSVAGRARAIELPLAVLPGMTAQEIVSKLPARLGDDGKLTVQARPGQWRVEVLARQSAPQAALKLPEGGAVAEEVWVLRAHPELRVVRPEGATSVDPSQVDMEPAWRQLPAFRLRAGESLKLLEQQRGQAKARPDALQLQRRLWLDFDGGGLTAHDRIEGRIAASSRLEMSAPGELGRASIDGEGQTITRLVAQGPLGFEVRGGAPSIEADSRWPRRSMSASGWRGEFDAVSAELNLPPGWRLLHADGPDRADGAWVSGWTLWDFFFVLLATLAAGKLLGWRTGALLGAALALSWHTAGSPPAPLWFVLLALLGVARALPEGRWQAGVRRASQGVALVIGLALLPFAVHEVRVSMYPSLDAPDRGHIQFQKMADAPAAAPAPPAEIAVKSVEERVVPPAQFSVSVQKSKPDRLDTVDPAARIQTGPGLPDWQWRRHLLQWSGPVSYEQTLSLWLLPPWATALMQVGTVALLAAALAALAGWRPRVGPGGWRGAGGAAVTALLLLTVQPSPAQAASPSAAAAAAVANAAYPSEDLLKALRDKVAAPPDCLPHCAALARLSVSAAGAKVLLRAEVHAQAEVAVPLPGAGMNWRPGAVTVDGRTAAARRDDAGQLWVALPAGVHQVTLEADVGAASSVDISLPLPVREVQAQLNGWTLNGLDPRGLATGAINLSREAAQAQGAKGEDAGSQRDALAPLVRVSRELQLGLRWSVLTRLERIAPSRAPLRVRWALLPGEVVNEASVKTEGGVASLQLGAEDAVEIRSTLTPTDKLQLQSGKEPNQIERWELAVSTQWHVDASGLAPVAAGDEAGGSSQWQPWPGESLTLKLSKPAGAGGPTLTIDGVRSDVSPGERQTQETLTLNWRASLGGQQTLKLPPDAELLGVKLDGQPLQIEAREGQLSLPVSPGAHTAELRWRLPQGMGLLWRREPAQLNLPGVNDHFTLNVPESRIVLAVGGPLLGPAVLIWGVLIVVALIAWRAPRVTRTPLRAAAWVLLGLGVAPVSLPGLALLAGWFVALDRRQRWGEATQRPRRQHMLVQVVLVAWTLAAMVALLDTLHAGLLGYPDLMVVGNGSNAHTLNWTADRFDTTLPSAWVLSAPLWAYRLAMLAWALWLAASLLAWVKWGWSCLASGGLWPARVAQPAKATAPAPAEVKSSSEE